MQTNTRAVHVEDRAKDAAVRGTRKSPGPWRLHWRFQNATQRVTVYTRHDMNAARQSVEALGCNIAGNDVRITSSSLWRGEVATGTVVVTFAEVAEDAITSRPRGTDRTRARYRQELRHADVLAWLDRDVASIGADELNAWKHALIRRGVAPRTVEYRLKLFRMTFRRAQVKGWRKDNPMTEVAPPAIIKRDRVHVLTVDEVARIIDATPSATDRILWHVLSRTGLRIGEALALQVRHVRLDGDVPEVHVRQGLSDDRKVIGNPKSEKSFRDVALDAETVELLRPLVIGRAASDWVFHNLAGEPLTYRTVLHHWTQAVAAAGIEPARIHDLRHSHATWLLMDGVPMIVVSRRLGHGTVAITADLYGHVDPSGIAAVLASMDGRSKAQRPTPLRRKRTG